MSVLLKKKFIQISVTGGSGNNSEGENKKNHFATIQSSATNKDETTAMSQDDVPTVTRDSPASITVVSNDEHDDTRSCTSKSNVSDPPTTQVIVENGNGNDVVPATDDVPAISVTTTTKSVRFDDKTMSSTVDHAYNELIRKYRTDIWYSREEYRNFWNDRMTSVRLWKCLFEDGALGSSDSFSRSCDFILNDSDYTVRGLENYLFSSSDILNRQRDLYTVVVLSDPYNTERIAEQVHDWSLESLQRAQLLALYDAADVLDDTAKTLSPMSPSYKQRQALKRLVSPPRSPASVLQLSATPPSTRKPSQSLSILAGISEMNKRLIEVHAKGDASQDHSLQRKKQKRQASTSTHDEDMDSSVSSLLDNVTQPRRNSTSGVSRSSQHAPHHRQPDRLRQLSEDFAQHMKFYNRLLNDLPKVSAPSSSAFRNHRRDSLGVYSDIDLLPVQSEKIKVSNTMPINIDDEYLLYHQMRRDSLLGGRQQVRRRSSTMMMNDNRIDDSHVLDLAIRRRSDALYQTMLTQQLSSVSSARDVDDEYNHYLYKQMLLEQQETQLNEYTSSIRSYSRLRRDSLAGNYGYLDTR